MLTLGSVLEQLLLPLASLGFARYGAWFLDPQLELDVRSCFLAWAMRTYFHCDSRLAWGRGRGGTRGVVLALWRRRWKSLVVSAQGAQYVVPERRCKRESQVSILDEMLGCETADDNSCICLGPR